MYLISATCIVKRDTSVVKTQTITIINNNSKLQKVHKLNFLQRLLVKGFLKKNKQQNGSKPDNLAIASLWLGIGACAFTLLVVLTPALVFGAIPAGIAAMITGGSAMRNKTSFIGKARTGKILGLGALIAISALILLVAILIGTHGLL